MQDNRIADEPLEGPGAWTIVDADGYKFLVSHDSPRSGSFLQALKVDIRNWQVLQVWATGFVSLSLGVTILCSSAKQESWVQALPGLFLTFMGGYLLFRMLRVFLAFVRKVRCGPVLRGRIPSLGRSSLVRGYSTVNAQLSDGRTILVWVRIAPALALLGGGTPAEVLILADPEEPHGHVIAIRAISRNQAGAEESRPSQ
jgi:hypothetical protein